MILILAAAAENICSNSFGFVYGLSHWSVCNQKNNLNPHQKSLHRRLPRQHSNRACATTATLWGIFECISNANSSLKFFGRWRWCRCRGRCRCRGCDSWSTCRICIFVIVLSKSVFRMSASSTYMIPIYMNMNCNLWKCKCDFWQTPSEIFYIQPHPSTRLHSRLTGDKTQIKRNTSVSLWDIFFGDSIHSIWLIASMFPGYL